jgi:hypothetical protein
MRELRFIPDLSPNHNRRASLQNLRLRREGETLKIYIATYESKEAKTTVPVAAQSLQHAARKAEKEADDRGELVEIRKSKDIII